jgi:hypothetical protein
MSDNRDATRPTRQQSASPPVALTAELELRQALTAYCDAMLAITGLIDRARDTLASGRPTEQPSWEEWAAANDTHLPTIRQHGPAAAAALAELAGETPADARRIIDDATAACEEAAAYANRHAAEWRLAQLRDRLVIAARPIAQAMKAVQHRDGKAPGGIAADPTNRRQRGAPERYDERADAKLVADYQVSDMSRLDFCRQRGIELQALINAQQRVSYRRRRDQS